MKTRRNVRGGDPLQDLAGFSSKLKEVTDAAKPGFEAVNNLKNMAAGAKTRRASSSGGDIVTHMLTIRNQVKLYHWQTGSFARHKATDDLTASLDEKIDEFVEVYMGKYGRPKVSGTIKLHNFSDTAAKSFVAKETKYLTVELPKKVKTADTDLLNIRDEILGDLNKVLYLFTLQ
jgi:DNA-binding ferritin-like protein